MDEMFLKVGGSDGEKARGFRTDENGNLGTRLVNLENKALNNVGKFDLKGKSKDSSIPAVVKRGEFSLTFDGSNTLTAPKPSDSGWVELGLANYENIEDDGNTGLGLTTTDNNKHACMLFSFNLLGHLVRNGEISPNTSVEEFRKMISGFEFNWDGYSRSKNAGTALHFWRPDLNRYSSVVKESNTSNRETISAPLYHITGEVPSNIIDDTGSVHFLARTKAGYDGDETRIFTYYVSINNLSITSEYLTTDTARVYDPSTDSLRVNVVDGNNAYDNTQDRYRVSIEDSVVQKTLENMIYFDRQGTHVETLYEGALQPEEGIHANSIICKYKGEHETRLLVNSDKAPFRFIVNAGPFTDISDSGTTFPDTGDYQTAHPNEYRPLHVLPIYGNSLNDIESATWEEAYRHRQLNDFQVRFINKHETDEANVTIKVMRIYKGC